jgi:hypothetical protein
MRGMTIGKYKIDLVSLAAVGVVSLYLAAPLLA